MRKILLYVCCFIVMVLSVLAIFLFSSKKEKIYSLNDTIKLHVNEKAKVEDLNIALRSITDSTCPKDVQCAWQGEYSYELLINKTKVILGTETAKEQKYEKYNIVLLNDTSKNYIKFRIDKIN